MDPTYSIEAEQYREKIRAFLAEHLPADWSGLRGLPEDQREEFVANWRALLSANHLIAPAWPVEYGGGGLSAIERVVLHEEFAQAGVPTGGPNDGFGIGMIGPTLMVLGTEEQKKTFLPRILSGEDRWCQGYSEPNSGSDLASLGTRAVDDGDEWVINGQKIWTSEGHTANWIFVLCRTNPTAAKHRGISFLLCPMDQPGIEVRPIINIVQSHDFNEVYFTEARTPIGNVISDVNDGWRVTNQLLAFERGDDATTVSFAHARCARPAGRRGLDPPARSTTQSCDKISRGLTPRSRSYDSWECVRSPKCLSGQVLGPESSINKLLWSELFQRMTEIGMHLYGAEAMAPAGEAPLSPVFTETKGDPPLVEGHG